MGSKVKKWRSRDIYPRPPLLLRARSGSSSSSPLWIRQTIPKPSDTHAATKWSPFHVTIRQRNKNCACVNIVGYSHTRRRAWKYSAWMWISETGKSSCEQIALISTRQHHSTRIFSPVFESLYHQIFVCQTCYTELTCLQVLSSDVCYWWYWRCSVAMCDKKQLHNRNGVLDGNDTSDVNTRYIQMYQALSTRWIKCLFLWQSERHGTQRLTLLRVAQAAADLLQQANVMQTQRFILLRVATGRCHANTTIHIVACRSRPMSCKHNDSHCCVSHIVACCNKLLSCKHNDSHCCVSQQVDVM